MHACSDSSQQNQRSQSIIFLIPLHMAVIRVEMRDTTKQSRIIFILGNSCFMTGTRLCRIHNRSDNLVLIMIWLVKPLVVTGVCSTAAQWFRSLNVPIYMALAGKKNSCKCSWIRCLLSLFTRMCSFPCITCSANGFLGWNLHTISTCYALWVLLLRSHEPNLYLYTYYIYDFQPWHETVNARST